MPQAGVHLERQQLVLLGHHVGAVGRDPPHEVPPAQRLAGRGAVHNLRIGTVAAIDGVGTITVVPNDGIVAVASIDVIDLRTAVNRVIAILSKQRVDALTAEDLVIASVAVQLVSQPGTADAVIPKASVDFGPVVEVGIEVVADITDRLSADMCCLHGHTRRHRPFYF